ncbi:MAG TPA: glycosyltransferase, partial [Acidimicrobiia bacterium]|nr:glycosyltransferase [Acidimicrobiia bacterium]
MTLSLVVPIYEETERFPEFAPRLAAFIDGQPAGSEIIFVDDGSTDGTATLANDFAREHARVRVLERAHAGKGAAVRAGLLDARADLAAFCDLDLSTPLEDLDALIEAAAARPILAIASRDLPSSRLV